MGITLTGLMIGCVLIGGALMIIGDHFMQPVIVYSGVLFFALGILAMALEGIVKRRFQWRSAQWPTGAAEGYGWETYRGYSAVACGIGALLIGALLFIYALPRATGIGDGVAEYLMAHPGLLVAICGATFAAWGIGMTGRYVIEHRGREYPIWWWWLNIPRGMLVVLFGLILCAVGLIGTFAPETAQNLKQAAGRWLLSVLERVI